MNDKRIDKYKNSKPLSMNRKRYIWAYIFMMPQIIWFFGLSMYPIIMSYVYSFYDWNGLEKLENFIGLANYKELLQTPEFWNAFQNSLSYAIGFTTVSVVLGLILALILNEPRFKAKGFYRTLYFLPVVTTAAIVGIIIQTMFGTQGAVNQLLLALGIIEQPISWLLDPILAMILLIVVGSWKNIGVTMIYWLTGLQTVPQDIHEAAQIDGAGYWKRLRYVTLPLLAPIGFTILLLTLTSSMHVFDLVKTLTNGGPYYSTETLELYIYRYAFASVGGGARTGFASAAGVLLGLFVFLITAVFAAIGWGMNRRRRNNLIKWNRGIQT
ncbi:carbohydrate ABC transporter permease [Gracilibacillus sp. D59]|uniref:carbohydrate ABC transporter permease n=1 Tax=Gracilibacillus sp. D59 TaxID=3457434 RepID=UPI003FCE68C7